MLLLRLGPLSVAALEGVVVRELMAAFKQTSAGWGGMRHVVAFTSELRSARNAHHRDNASLTLADVRRAAATMLSKATPGARRAGGGGAPLAQEGDLPMAFGDAPAAQQAAVVVRVVEEEMAEAAAEEEQLGADGGDGGDDLWAALEEACAKKGRSLQDVHAALVQGRLPVRIVLLYGCCFAPADLRHV